MSTLNVAEYRGALAQAGGNVPVPDGPPLKITAFAFTSASAFTCTAQTRLLRIVQPTSACYYSLTNGDTTPVASTTAGIYLPSGTVEYIGVSPKAKVSVYDGGS